MARPSLLALLALALNAALAWPAAAAVDDVVPLSIEQRGDALELTLQGRKGARITLLAGAPWRGTDAIDGELPGLYLEPGAATTLFDRVLPTERQAHLTLDGKTLSSLPDPCVLQALAVARGPERHLLAASPAYLVRRQGGLTLTPFDAHLRDEALPGAVIAGALLLLLVPLLAWIRWPRVPAAAGTALLVIAVAALLVLRLRDDAPRGAIERGFRVPPLLWPTAWKDDDALERVLGPGFRELVTATRDATRAARLAPTAPGSEDAPADVPVVVLCPPEGLGYLRGFHLAHELDARLLDATTNAPPRGLVIQTVGAPRGDAITRTKAGVLTRVGP